MKYFIFESHKLGDLVRSPAGTKGFFILRATAKYNEVQQIVASYASRAQAQIEQSKRLVINPITLVTEEALTVRVIKKGTPRKPRGRTTKRI